MQHRREQEDHEDRQPERRGGDACDGEHADDLVGPSVAVQRRDHAQDHRHHHADDEAEERELERDGQRLPDALGHGGVVRAVGAQVALGQAHHVVAVLHEDRVVQPVVLAILLDLRLGRVLSQDRIRLVDGRERHDEEYEDEDEDDYQIDDELDEDHKEDFDFEKESTLDINDHDSDEDDGDFADLDSFEDEEELDSSDDYLDLEFDEKPAPEPEKETSKSAPTPDIDEVLEIEEPSEDEITERMGKFDTGFVVQGRYDLSATSEIGLKLGLTEEQKQLFSYFVPIRGVSEQLVEILDNDKRCRNRYGTSRTGNILILGRKGSGKTVLAVDIVKAIQKQRRLKQGKVAIVTGDSLNKKDIGSIIDKLNGGALIIEKASKMNDRTIRELNDMMDEQTGELLFLLEDQKKPLERMFASHREFKRKFTSRLELPVFINDELVTFGQTYAKENGYRIDEMGILALYSRIDMMQREDHAVTVAEVKEIMDEAISHSQKANVKHLVKRVFGRSTDNSDHIILKEDDFKS